MSPLGAGPARPTPSEPRGAPAPAQRRPRAGPGRASPGGASITARRPRGAGREGRGRLRDTPLSEPRLPPIAASQ